MYFQVWRVSMVSTAALMYTAINTLGRSNSGTNAYFALEVELLK